MGKTELYKQAENKWGKNFQLLMLMGECGELIQACSKQMRGQDKFNICIGTEVADVEIMIDMILI